MKKSTVVYFVCSLFASLALFTGCSSAPVDGSAEATAPVEAAASNDAFNNLVNNDPGAVVDQSTPVVVAAAEPSHQVSPVNLGASSAGRAH